MDHPSNGELSQQVGDLQKSLAPLIKISPKLEEIAEAYDSVMFGKKFLIGLATVIGSIAVIGGGILWLLNYIRHGQ